MESPGKSTKLLIAHYPLGDHPGIYGSIGLLDFYWRWSATGTGGSDHRWEEGA